MNERAIQLALLLAIPAMAIAAGLAASLVVRRRSGRLKEISRLAAEINPRRLGRRLDTTGEHGELGRLSAEINRMLSRLETGFAAQDRFISEVAHELKTPVSVLLLEAQVLARSDPDPIVFAKFVASVEEEMLRLAKLVESLLALARFGHGDPGVRRVTVDINDAAMEAGQHCWAYARLREIRLSVTLASGGACPDGAIVAGDPELLRIMIENLLRNAIAVSPRRSAVDLRVSCADGRVTVFVRDRGPGVPDDLAPRIFERFVTADHAQQGSKGSGLGLAIARGIAELHGGGVRFRNLPGADGGGAEFFVHVPVLDGASGLPLAPPP